MKLTRFSLTADNKGIQKKETQFDLSSCFNFVGLDYDVINRELQLRWIKGSGEQIPHTYPDELSLEFTDVSLFKIQERDTAAPYADDESLITLGFMDNNAISEFSDSYQHEASEAVSHLCLEFNSGLKLKIIAAEATLSSQSRI